jgi:hypothetical protein
MPRKVTRKAKGTPRASKPHRPATRFKSPPKAREKERPPVLLPPGAGRAYAMGPVHAVFKADGNETRGGYSLRNV